MTDKNKTTLSIIEKRLRKLESKIIDISDNYDEIDNNVEDLYDTINNMKTPQDTASHHTSHHTSHHASNTKTTKQIDKHIDKNIDKYISEIEQYNISNSQAISNFAKQQALIFYNKLIKSNPDLLNGNDKMQIILTHIKYFLEQNNYKRDSILDTLDKVDNIIVNKEPKMFRILNSSLDIYQKKIALNKLQLLDNMKQDDNTSTSNEYFKLNQWLDTLLSIPFNIYQTPYYLEINTNSDRDPCEYLLESRAHLDTVIYGQQETKQHIIEILARMIRNPQTLGSVFAIHGEAGTGKTTLIKDGLSKIFGLPFIFISLGGAQDSSYLNGHGYCYEGSSCGKIIQSLKQAQCMNPIFYFDELDKVSQTDKGQEIINLLVHLTDYTQNSHFIDNYMDGIAIDLSRATFVFSFNNKNLISPILLDRMEMIKFKSYSIQEKMHIARHFLLPSVIRNVFGKGINGNDGSDGSDGSSIDRYSTNFTITDNSLKKIIMSNNKINDKLNYKINYVSRYKNKTNKTNKYSKYNNIIKPNNMKNKNYMKYMKNMKHMKYMKYMKQANETKGGVRYIKKRLERIISYINVDIMINRNNNSKEKHEKHDKNSKKNNTKCINITDKIVNDVLYKKY